ncbi:serine/threonine-protein kinase [Actinocorallia longicatena]
MIGLGGMGVVYEAHDPSLERQVALKVMSDELVENPAWRARFSEEAKYLASVRHPHLLPIYKYGEQDGVLYFTMQLAMNGVLRDLVRPTAPISPGHAFHVMGQLASALEELHRNGIVHRDCTPENVFLNGGIPGQENVLLGDFGLAWRASAPAAPPSGGALDYRAPEQTVGMPVTAQADVYSFAVVLYELLVGTVPFIGDRRLLTMLPDQYAELRSVFLRAFSPLPEERYSSPGTLLAEARDALILPPGPVSQAHWVGSPDSLPGTDRPPFVVSDFDSPQVQSPPCQPADDAVASPGPQPYVPMTASDAVPIPGTLAEENSETPGEAPSTPAWPGRRAALGVLGGAALITVGVALWPDRDRPLSPERPWRPVPSDSFTPADTREIRIRPADFDPRSRFSKYGPVYEDDPSIVQKNVLSAHVYGQVTGRFVYTFTFNGVSTGEARLRAYLSADSVQYKSTPGTFSDVEVLVNGHQVDMLRVVSDQGHGESCTVPFDSGLLRQGENTLVFRVREDAKYAHGLCIYGESLTPGLPDKWIGIVV